MYVYTDGAIENDHPIRRSVYTAFAWLLVHLPMSAGLLIGGHTSAASTFEEELHRGQRWLWGGGLGVGMFGMWIIGQLYLDCDPPGKLLLSKVMLFGQACLVRVERTQLTTCLAISPPASFTGIDHLHSSPSRPSLRSR